jgi:hypothetical protein
MRAKRERGALFANVTGGDRRLRLRIRVASCSSPLCILPCAVSSAADAEPGKSYVGQVVGPRALNSQVFNVRTPDIASGHRTRSKSSTINCSLSSPGMRAKARLGPRAASAVCERDRRLRLRSRVASCSSPLCISFCAVSSAADAEPGKRQRHFAPRASQRACLRGLAHADAAVIPVARFRRLSVGGRWLSPERPNGRPP